MAESLISIDYALAMADGVGALGGLNEQDLDREAVAFERAVHAVREQVDKGKLGFWKLPSDRAMVEKVTEVKKALGSEIRDVLVLGIGGSSLGARAIHQALAGPIEVPQTEPLSRPRLHFPDNSDPWLLANLLNRLDPAGCAVLVISKSGGTVETAAQQLIARQWLLSRLGANGLRQRMVAITDPTRGTLREIVVQDGLLSLEIPTNVGGRFSVLSAVGLLPACLCGVDIEAMLQGAAAMAARCGNAVLRENPAGILATVHVLHHRLRGRSIHVIMPYADRLRAFAAWFAQLWAESLGKRLSRYGSVVEQGPTPLPAVGATDQHAQMQLFMEGPRDKLLTFIQVKEVEVDLQIPYAPGPYEYLGKTTLAQLLDAERRGVTEALARDGRPSITVTLERVDAATLGGLFFLYEAATAFAGELYAVDAFDQPGVEEGKRLAFGLLGRKGYESAAQEFQAASAARPSRYRVF
jgi:glucose-6-phosphate isomerase